MERVFPRIERKEKLIKDVYLLIDLKIKNIENETTRFTSKHYLDEPVSNIEKNTTSQSFISKKAIEVGLNKQLELLEMIERNSRAIHRLRRIRSLLCSENAQTTIDLLSNDSYLHCDENEMMAILLGDFRNSRLYVA